MKNLHVVLMHWPIVNRQGELVNTATTNLDIHDIARASFSYGVKNYWLVQPMQAQLDMIQRIVGHWTTGPGTTLHPDRPTALSIVKPVASIDDITEQYPNARWVVTSAKPDRVSLTPQELGKQLLDSDQDVFLCFGTGWGLAPQVMAVADDVLTPIVITDYNHLSVRSAVSIYLDRVWQGTQPSQ